MASEVPSAERSASLPSNQYSRSAISVASATYDGMMKYFVTGLLHSPSESFTRMVSECIPAASEEMSTDTPSVVGDA